MGTNKPPTTRTDDTPPAKKPPGGDTPPPQGSGIDDGPCCCKSITLYLMEVSVDEETDAPSLPGPLSGLVGFFTDDRVSVVAVPECGDRKPQRWPRTLPFETVPKGHPAIIGVPGAPMATVYPDADCYVSCDIQIDALRVSRADDLIAELTALLDKLTQLAEDLSGLRSGKALLKALGKDLGQTEKEIDDLWQKVSELLRKLKADNLMAEFFIGFHGSLLCKGDFAEFGKGNPIAKPTPGDPNSIDYTKVIENFKGKWTLKFRATRDCHQSKAK
jgi:hypothetical protein